MQPVAAENNTMHVKLVLHLWTC